MLLNKSLEIKNFIKDPTKSISQQNVFIKLLAEKLNFYKKFKNFFLLWLKEKNFFIEKISESFWSLFKKRGEVKASLISSKELSQSELEAISKDLSETMGLSLKFDYKLDTDLIGGLKLQLGSIMIDTSIKNKLKKYKQAMLEN